MGLFGSRAERWRAAENHGYGWMDIYNYTFFTLARLEDELTKQTNKIKIHKQNKLDAQ